MSPPRRFLRPDQHPPRDTYGVWAAVVAVVLLFWVVFVVAFLPREAAADHDGDDQPWRRPLLDACAATWDYTSTRVTVDAPGHPQHGRSLHDQPFEVRDIFYRTWFRDTEDERAVDAHLIQWRREYECTHPAQALVTVGGRLPRGGGGPIFVDRGTDEPEGYPGPNTDQNPPGGEPERTETIPPTPPCRDSEGNLLPDDHPDCIWWDRCWRFLKYDPAITPTGRYEDEALFRNEYLNRGGGQRQQCQRPYRG